ncbi:unnamed protein product, partial [Cyprideis torosa]
MQYTASGDREDSSREHHPDEDWGHGAYATPIYPTGDSTTSTSCPFFQFWPTSLGRLKAALEPRSHSTSVVSCLVLLPDDVKQVSFAPDEVAVLVGYRDGKLDLITYNSTTGKSALVTSARCGRKKPSQASAITYCPVALGTEIQDSVCCEKFLILACADGFIRVFETTKLVNCRGMKVAHLSEVRVHAGAVSSVALPRPPADGIDNVTSPWLATAGQDKVVKVWKMEDFLAIGGNSASSPSPVVSLVQRSGIARIRWVEANESTVLIIGTQSGSISVLDPFNSRKSPKRLGEHPGSLSEMIAQEPYVVTAGSGSVVVWSVLGTRVATHRLQGGAEEVVPALSVALSTAPSREEDAAAEDWEVEAPKKRRKVELWTEEATLALPGPLGTVVLMDVMGVG